MRKKCSQCGLVNFVFDEICKKCGSDKLFKFDIPNNEAVETPKKLPLWAYLIFLVLAVIIEFITLLPELASMGMRHSANTPLSDYERVAQFWIFLMNIPSTLIPWLLTFWGEIFSTFYIFVPFTQIIFWTFFLALIWKKLEKVYAALVIFAFLLTFLLLSLSIFR